MNLSRIVGPLVAGALIASAGSVWVFALNAVLSRALGLRRPALAAHSTRPSARAGAAHQRDARRRAVRAPVAADARGAAAGLDLLPPFDGAARPAAAARARPAGGDAGTFTLLLASMGAGAIVAVLVAAAAAPGLRPRPPRARRHGGAVGRHRGDGRRAQRLGRGAGHARRRHGLDHGRRTRSRCRRRCRLPNWVRARGMASYQMAIMGASALGAALWGQVATVGSMQTALLLGGRQRRRC